MLRGLWAAFKSLVDNARVGGTDAIDPYVLLCNTPEFSNKNDGDFDCDVPWLGAVAAKMIPEVAGLLDAPLSDRTSSGGVATTMRRRARRDRPSEPRQ